MKELSFLGVGEPEAFRCRVYGENDDDAKRRAFIEMLAGPGVIDCPAYDAWIDAFESRGQVAGELEPNPDGPGKVKRWRLNERGRRWWEEYKR